MGEFEGWFVVGLRGGGFAGVNEDFRMRSVRILAILGCDIDEWRCIYVL